MRFEQLGQMFLYNHSILLCKTYCNKTSFIVLNGPISKNLDPVNPLTTNHKLLRGESHQIPSMVFR